MPPKPLDETKSVTGMTEEKLTAAVVAKQLLELEAAYRARKKKLRALLAVLQQEEREKADADN